LIYSELYFLLKRIEYSNMLKLNERC